MPVYEVKPVNSHPYYLEVISRDFEDLIFLIPDTVSHSELNDCSWLNDEKYFRSGPELLQGKTLKSYGADPRFPGYKVAAFN